VFGRKISTSLTF